MELISEKGKNSSRKLKNTFSAACAQKHSMCCPHYRQKWNKQFLHDRIATFEMACSVFCTSHALDDDSVHFANQMCLRIICVLTSRSSAYLLSCFLNWLHCDWSCHFFRKWWIARMRFMYSKRIWYFNVSFFILFQIYFAQIFYLPSCFIQKIFFIFPFFTVITILNFF